MDPTQLLIEYGPKYFPLVVFVCAIIENDVTFVMAGIYAASVHTRPYPNVTEGIIAGIAGALCHDTFWFYLGHHRSRWIKTTKAWRKVGPQIETWAKKFGPLELFLCRFIPGTRNTSLLFWGVQRLRIPYFFLIDISALALWGTTLMLLGYKFSQTAELILIKIRGKSLGRYLLWTLLFTLIVYFIVRQFTRHEIVKHGRPPEDPRAD